MHAFPCRCSKQLCRVHRQKRRSGLLPLQTQWQPSTRLHLQGEQNFGTVYSPFHSTLRVLLPKSTLNRTASEENAVSKLSKALSDPHSSLIKYADSKRSHRALRRLQSAHTLGQSNIQPSLISQQHRAIQRTNSPSNSKDPTPNRGRSNSDATNMNPPNLGAAGRRPIPGKRSTATDALSLDRLIRDGPPDGDLIGGLEATRLKILDQGIKSDSDGMVRAKNLSISSF